MKATTQPKAALLAAFVTIALVLASSADDADGKIESTIHLSECPAAVQNTIKNTAVGGTLLEVEKETLKDGAARYEAEIRMADGRVIEIEVAEDGRLLKIEEEADDEHGDEDNE